MSKGLDTAFIHYGIRKEDMDIIKNLTEEQGLDFEWLQENLDTIFEHERKPKILK